MSPVENEGGGGGGDSGADNHSEGGSTPSPTPGAGPAGAGAGHRELTVPPPPVGGVLVSAEVKYAVVAWDLDTTGRRLIDEICHIGGFYYPKGSDEDKTFSQYVMPYKNPNPGARKSFGIRVVNIGRYRMLKDMDTGKILKTKSEVSALQDFIDWIKGAKENSQADGVLLACHEPTRKVLVPLLLEALSKYNLMEPFKEVAKGFVNAVAVANEFGDTSHITSYSLRSLCKTVLHDTNPNTNSASDRSKVLVDIMAKLTSEDEAATVEAAKVAKVAYTVESEEGDLAHLKAMLSTQGTLRPIFESQLRQKRSVRERAMTLRKMVAESGLDYSALSEIYKGEEDTKDALQKKLQGPTEADVEQLIELMKSHFDGTGEEDHAKDGGDGAAAAARPHARKKNFRGGNHPRGGRVPGHRKPRDDATKAAPKESEAAPVEEAKTQSAEETKPQSAEETKPQSAEEAKPPPAEEATPAPAAAPAEKEEN